MTDIAMHYARLADGFLDRIRATPADRWDAPSPCEGWTARDVVAHVINGHRGILAMVTGIRPAPADGVGVSAMADAPAVEPGTDLAAAFTHCRDAMLAALTDPARSETPLPHGPLGPVPLREAVEVIGGLELLVHTWDLARATGGDEKLDPELVARTHTAALPHQAAIHSTGAFQESIPAPADADPQTAFLHFVGRRP